ncbi:alpha/beta fold hydrolase [Cribrihabitans neustonicus]|uniref:alpha/beta fold hydrolase n=1 Tax=Cribrihabitans neustonicus TaxID=1429085 RepID=UPI003B5A30B3
MPHFSPAAALSQDQVAAAIYETMIRPEQYDRFSPFQQPGGFNTCGGWRAAPRVPAPAPGLQAHFGRAREIQDRQWVRSGRPHPCGFYDDNARAWLLADARGRLLRVSRQAQQILGGTCSPGAVMQLTAGSRRRWEGFLEKLRSRAFDWNEVLVLETAEPQRKLLCRPVWTGAGEGVPVAAMAELLEFEWQSAAAARVAGAFGVGETGLTPLRGLMAGAEAPCPEALAALDRIAALAGAPGIAELVRLVAFLLQEQADDLAIARGERLPPSRELLGTGGRRTQYFRLGADTGRPVVFVHGLMDVIAPVQRLQPHLRHLGLRVYAPLRGGYGASSPVPCGQRPVEAFMQQIKALILEENLQRPILLAHRGGAPFARAAAERLRGRVPGMVVAAATGPMLPEQPPPDLKGVNRAAALLADRAPRLLPLLVSSWPGGCAALLHAQSAPGSRERHLLGQLDLRGVLGLSQELFLAQKGAGFAADLAVLRQGWRGSSGKGAGAGDGVRSVYLHGGDDRTTPLHRMREAVAAEEGSQLRVCRDAGTLLLYTFPELILEALSGFAAPERG